MKFHGYVAGAVAVALLLTSVSTVSMADVRRALAEFRRTFNSNQVSTREKNEAIQGLPSNDKAVVDEYINILETDVWQWRSQVLGRLQQTDNAEILNAIEEWVLNERNLQRQPSAGEHIVWALFNNRGYLNAEKSAKLASIVQMQRATPKVKNRVVRELGVWRGDQPLGRAHAGLLVGMLEWHEGLRRGQDETLKFLIIDSLESLTTQEFDDNVRQWRFWIDNLEEDAELRYRTPERFEDQHGDVDIRGHSFVRRGGRSVESVDVLILPDFGWSEHYWYPYIFELNKMFNCVFVELPDASRVEGLRRPQDRRTGAVDPNAYYYPLEQLVKAFEERREASGHEKVGIIAHGISAWIAMEYSRLYPDSVLFCIALNSFNGNQSFSGARNEMANSRDMDIRWYSELLIYDPSNRTGPGSMDADQMFHGRTGSYKSRFADPRAVDSTLFGAIPQRYRKPVGGGSALVPEYDITQAFGRNRTSDVPMLFIWGAKDPMYVEGDQRGLQRIYRRSGMFEVFPESARTPWAEEPIRFFETVRTFLERSGVDLKPKEKEE
jgi:pimeloyl-ACP methyl ester carboxylesterase